MNPWYHSQLYHQWLYSYTLFNPKNINAVVLYIRDHEDLGFSSQKCHPKTSLNFPS